MSCFTRSPLLRYQLLLSFLTSQIWQGPRLALCTSTGARDAIVPQNTDAWSCKDNSTYVNHPRDCSSVTTATSSQVSNFETSSPVTIRTTDFWKSLELEETADINPYLTPTEARSPAFLGNDLETVHEITESQCLAQSVITFSGQTGSIHGLFDREKWPTGLSPYCMVRVVVPEGKYVQATLDMTKHVFDFSVTASEDPVFADPASTQTFTASQRLSPLLLSGSNHIFFKLELHAGLAEFQIRFAASEEDLRTSLRLVRTSSSSGYVTTWGFEANRRHPCFMNASRTIHLPLNHLVMVSFSRVDLHYYPDVLCTLAYVRVYKIEDNGSLSQKMEICVNSITPALLLFRSIQVQFYAVTCLGRGFKMLFTFHPLHETPVSLSSGLWDCSASHYSTFKEHLECNLEVECQGGEDEGAHCSFSSPACNGSVAVANKCYIFYTSSRYTIWPTASRECRNRGGNLANMKTGQEWEALNKIYRFSKSPLSMHVGLSTYDDSLPPQYKKVPAWSDGTVAYDYNQHVLSAAHHVSPNVYDTYCSLASLNYADLFIQSCALELEGGIPLCEFSVGEPVCQASVAMPFPKTEYFTQNNGTRYLLCPQGHFTLDFLLCDRTSRCTEQTFPRRCQTWTGLGGPVATEMFVCSDASSTLHYSLVCDFRSDCPDGSDESFCARDPHCEGFRCRNGQCVDVSNRCDVDRNCWDGSDEECDMFRPWSMDPAFSPDPPAAIDFGLNDDLLFWPLNLSDLCPDTHFRCPPDGYCLPVNLRCNGVYDCPYHEDEADCASYTCPGFYRCRASSVCVHADHMCDGRPQCPQHDDEQFCGLSCPQGCLCQGLAFVCATVFETQKFPDIRYLDASGSGMSTGDVSSSIHLVWLSLASCKLQELSNMSLPSLQSLDLSDNFVSWLDMSYFTRFENLRILRLAGNPLQSVFTSDTEARHSFLTHLDLSRTLLKSFEGQALQTFPALQTFNLSFISLKLVSLNSFRHTPNLVELDLRSTTVEEVHAKALAYLTSLRVIRVSYYTLCCKEILPSVDDLLCFSPADTFSSCQNLLRSKSVFVLLWAVWVASIAGNFCCVLYTIFTEKEKSCWGFSCLVINLNASDLLMGVYLLVIGVADQAYRDRYVWHEQSWTSGTLCQVAGLVYSVSTEASAMSMMLLSLERLLVSSGIQLHGLGVTVACCCAWLVSLVLAFVPVLPMISQWEVYRQNSVCAPLPVYREGFGGWPYVSGVSICLNLALILVADVFHVLSLYSTPLTILGLDDQEEKGDRTTGRRLTLLLVAKTVSTSLLSTTGLTTQMGTSYPLDITSGLLLMIPPFSASLNPCLYALSILCEERRNSEKQRLLKMLESRCQRTQETVKSDVHHSGADPCSRISRFRPCSRLRHNTSAARCGLRICEPGNGSRNAATLDRL